MTTAQQNTANHIRIYAERVAMFTMNGTEWADIVRTLDRMQVKAIGHCAYIRDAIAHARQIAHGHTDTQDSRAEIYADMELLEIYIISTT